MKDLYYNWHIFLTLRHLNGLTRAGYLLDENQKELLSNLHAWFWANPDERSFEATANFRQLYPKIRHK